MISIWFTRDTRDSDPLLAARDSINQALFERTAQENNIQVLSDTADQNVVELGSRGDYNAEQYASFFKDLAAVGLDDLTVDYETEDEKTILESADPDGKFNLVCIS